MSMEASWRNLFDSIPSASPFASWEWASAWWTQLGNAKRDAAQSLIFVVRDEDGELCGIAPFHFRKISSLTMDPYCLRPWGVLGTRYQDITEEPIILLRKGCEEQILRAILATLGDQAKCYKWDFTQVQVAFPTNSLLKDFVLRTDLPNTLKTVLLRREETPMYKISLPNTWEMYKATLSQSSRESLNRKPKLLTRACSTWSVRNVSSYSEIGSAADLLVRLHRDRASVSNDRVSHLPARDHRMMLRNAFEKMAENGLASVYILEADGEPIAAQSVFRVSNRILFYYSGFDPKWQNVSPMIILHSSIIQDAIAHGVVQIDLHRFDQEWKMRLGAVPYSLFQQLISIRPSIAALIRTGIYSKSRKSRDIVEGEF